MTKNYLNGLLSWLISTAPLAPSTYLATPLASLTSLTTPLLFLTPALAFLASAASWASPILEPNISVMINGKNYVCSGSGSGSSSSGCEQKVKGIRTILTACGKSYSGGYCVGEHWPKFKSQNPDCLYDGLETCLEFCGKSYSPAYCLSQYCST